MPSASEHVKSTLIIIQVVGFSSSGNWRPAWDFIGHRPAWWDFFKLCGFVFAMTLSEWPRD
jgi:hypothetical protein